MKMIRYKVLADIVELYTERTGNIQQMGLKPLQDKLHLDRNSIKEQYNIEIPEWELCPSKDNHTIIDYILFELGFI